MLEQLSNHIDRHALCKITDKILLAVSGGLDSMVMLHLMRQAGYRLGVAHANFQLRGDESVADEVLVRDTCQRNHIPFFCRRFDTPAYAADRRISVQMAARDLRYAYFGELLTAEGYDLVATGHHYTDVVESVLLNIIRGTGIDGFRGIAVKKGKIIRPMLFATRRMIESYALKEKIVWREDASNASDDYQRNFLRHQVIPRMEEMNPAFEQGFRQTHERLLGARALMLQYLEGFRRSALEVRNDRETLVNIRMVDESPSPAVLLWELIKEHGFNFTQCCNMVEDHHPGTIFHSDSHQVVVDRTHYIIERKQATGFVRRTIERGQSFAGETPFVLSLREVARENFHLKMDSSLGQLDADRLQFPLVWRKWEAGDYFVPLGMQQEKKLSDFLIDLKVPFNSKADLTVVQSGKDIVWVAGFRVSERYKVTDKTRRVLILELKAERD